MSKLYVIIASTRPGRVGLPVGQWFFERAQAHGKFEVELVDLKEVGLPFLDEPNHPRLQKYEHAHTLAWSERIRAADAFVFVTPEYNYSAPATLINALDFLYNEWNYKPAAFVSYGGVSGGTRSAQVTKQVLATLRMMAIPEGVSIPFVGKSIEDGVFTDGARHERSLTTMLDELWRWADALSALRA